jgi:epoxyqueuosine reductase
LDEVSQGLRQKLNDAGFKSAIVPIQHLHELRYDIQNPLEGGYLSIDLYHDWLSGFKFRPPEDLPAAKSIILIAAHQPEVRVIFKLPGRSYTTTIPPTYLHHTDELAAEVLSSYLSKYGYRISEATIPLKSLAVHSGLAAYGKNNITYIEGWGSTFRLKSFISDMPCPTEVWGEFKMMERCENCSACVNRCPTGAITKDRFLIHAERCMTYLNEGKDDFPGWIDPGWHNCLIGCMHCQAVCPENKPNRDLVSEGGVFTETETRKILQGIPKDELPQKTYRKLVKLYMLDDYHLLPRNLGALIQAMGNQDRPDVPVSHPRTGKT